MPITIKEIISSDSMSGMIEKVNFNFDQLILAGGGPPGIQGLQGIDGPVGPQGLRGDHWFSGPSAFGQTADHNGTSSLKVEDHYLDENGDVFKYYETSLGATGWTASGINLKGPAGATGADGGSLEWKTYIGITGNLIDGTSFGPSDVVGSSNLVDFLIPNNTVKNSVFVGDPNWAYWNLENFGANNFAIEEISAIPKFAIIQNSIGPTGLNGVSFGGPLLAIGSTSEIYGDAGSTSAGGPTYSAWNFVNASFVTEKETFVSDWITKWRIHSFRSNIKIKAGGTYVSPTQGYRSATLELEGGNTRIKDYTNDKFINLEKTITVNVPGVLSANLSEIQINSKPIISSISSIDGVNTFGYVALQNSEGTGIPTFSSGWPEHKYGSVIIGPTYNTVQSIPVATPNHQSIAIVRQITKFDGVDAAIRFFQPTIQSNNENHAKVLTMAGSITPVRTVEDSVNANGLPGVVLDSLMLNVGSFDINGNTVSSLGATAYNAGRLGLSNNTITLSKPQFPVHVSVIPDSATRRDVWDGDSSANLLKNRFIKYWFAGFDAKDSTSNRNPGIALGSTQWKDDATVVQSFTNPIIKTYTRLDSNLAEADYISSPISGRNIIPKSQIQGTYNPHLYLQSGGQLDTGNIGIGFEPGSTAYNLSGSIDIDQISYAKAKLSVNGSVSIGYTHSKYHNYDTNIPNSGLLVQGLIAQGDTLSQGLGTLVLGKPDNINSGEITGVDTSLYKNFPNSNDDYSFRIQLGLATEKHVLAKGFISKGSPSPMYPDFALPDAKTGMGRMIGELGVGALYANRTPYLTGSEASVSDTSSPVVVAKFSASADGLYKNNPTKAGVGGFMVTNAFALEPAYYDLNTLPWYTVSVLAEDVVGTGEAHQIVYHQIPSKNSTAFIDLREPMDNLPYFDEYTPCADFQISTTPLYLSGFDPISELTFPQRYNSRQFTIEDGYYDGQILRIMFLDVHTRNFSVLAPNAIPDIYPDRGVPANPTDVNKLLIKDNIVMAAEKWSGSTSGVFAGNTWPIIPSNFLNNPTMSPGQYHQPWPMPGNIEFINGVVPPLVGVTPAGIQSAIQDSFNQWANANNRKWTNTSTSIYSDVASYPNNSFFTIGNSEVLDFQGVGAFKIMPWRSITLQWKTDNIDFGEVLNADTSGFIASYGKGAWFEVARENLVPRKIRQYSGSGGSTDYASIVKNEIKGETLYGANQEYRTFKNSTASFTYSFYNPSGESTMTIYSNGTPIKVVTMSESGVLSTFVPTETLIGATGYLTDVKVVITTIGQSGTNNKVEARIKITKSEYNANYDSSIIKDINASSTGAIVTLDTAPVFSFEYGYSYAIEGVAIIQKQSI